MNSSIWFDTMDLGWFIVHIQGSQIRIAKVRCLKSLKIVFILANRVDPAEILHSALFHLWLHCLPKYPIPALVSTDTYEKYCLIPSISSQNIELVVWFVSLCLSQKLWSHRDGQVNSPNHIFPGQA